MKQYLLAFLLLEISISIIAQEDKFAWTEYDSKNSSSEPSNPVMDRYNSYTDEEKAQLDERLRSIFKFELSDDITDYTENNDFEQQTRINDLQFTDNVPQIADNVPQTTDNVLQNRNNEQETKNFMQEIKNIMQKTKKTVADSQNTINVTTNFTDALETFSNEFYRTVTKNNSNNILVSALSANLALGMLASGAEESTKGEILQTLHLSEMDRETKSNYGKLYSYAISNLQSDLKIFNQLFIASHLKVKQAFRNITSSYFFSEERQLSFRNPEQAASEINNWVSNATNDKIKNIISSDDLDALTNLVLANVIYFKGEWKYKFSNVWQNRDFHAASGEIEKVDLMRENFNNIDFGYVPDANARFVELPYKGDQLKMIVILPNYGVNLEQVERKLETMTLKNLRMKRFTKTVLVSLPKFKIESSIDLKDILQKMGIRQLFSTGANLTGIADEVSNVRKMKQQTFIEVNENGAEAAAATVAEVSSRMGSDDEVFYVDHPFHFKIIKTLGDNDGIVLFSGNYLTPN